MAIKELFNDARPQVLFDPRASQRIDTRFKFTRAGVASYHDVQGILRYAPANQPRFEHNPLTGEFEGLLLEGSKQNLFAESTNLTGPGWSVDGISVTSNTGSIVTPDQTSTADRINYNSGTGNYRAFYFVGGTVRTETISFFIKPAPGTLHFHNFFPIGSIGGTDGGIGSGWGVGINFSNNTLYRVSNSNVSYNSGGMALDLYPNGWRRISYTYLQNDTGGSSSFFQFMSSESAAISGFVYGDVYIWGLQREIGGPSSYIPTAGSQVTRPADLLTIEAPLPTTGSIYIDARSLASDVDNTLLSAAPASPSTDKLTLAVRQPASLYNSKALVYEVDGAFKPTLPFPVPTNARERNLITYGANNYHYRSDSARYTPSSSTSVPANMTRLGIGHDVTDPTKAMTGYINAVYLWPGEITPTVAEALVRGDADPKDADAGVFTPAAGSLAFVFNTQGTATDGNTVVQLPLRGSTNNVLVDWGDNTSSSLIGSAASVTVNHTYSSAGIYPVQIEADDDGTNSGLENLQFYANSPADLVRVLQWGGSTTFNPTTMYRIFRDCTQMDFATAARTNLPDTSGCSDWREAFRGCSSLSGQYPNFDHSGASGSIQFAWFGCSSITSFSSSLDDLNSAGNYVTNYSYAWEGCSSITSFPAITIPNDQGAISLLRAWKDCSGLTSFPTGIDTSAATDFNSTWYGCSGLTAFTTLNVSNGTNFDSCWFGCSDLTSFTITNFVSATTLAAAFYGWSSFVGTFPTLTTSTALTNLSQAWRQNAMTVFNPPTTTSAVLDMSRAWQSCTGLTAFPGSMDCSACTNFNWAWSSCSNLTAFPSTIDTSAGTSFHEAWFNCDGLTAFPALNFDAATGLASDASNVYTGFRGAWQSCNNLATFPANLFDNTTCTRFLDAFKDCALTVQSIENILVSINTAGTSNGNLSLEGGTNANTSTWSTAANNAYIALVGRGWTITQNGTAPS